MRFRTTDNLPPDYLNQALIAACWGQLVIPAEFEEEHKKFLELGIGTNAIGAVSYNNHCNEEKEGNVMATIVKKSELKFIDGYLSYDGTLVAPSFIESYLSLEDFLQHAAYANALPAPTARFVKETIIDARPIEVPKPETPVSDKEAKKADKLSEENKLVRAHLEAEGVLDRYNEIVNFVVNDNVVIHDYDYRAALIDAPTLGDPLKLTKEKLLELVCAAVEYPLG